MEQQSSIMAGRVKCTLGDILSLKNGYAFKSSDYQALGVPIIRISDIQNESVCPNNAKCIYEHEEFDNYQIRKGDLLIAMSGATTGKFGLYKSGKKAYQNQRVGNFRPHVPSLVNNSFIFYLLHSLKRFIEKNAYGGAQPNISSNKIEKLEIVLPPLNEQHRIVAKIEELFSELDKGIESLKTARQQLKVYRQALLKHAFEGKLTEQWRAENADPLELASELLERIQQQRQTRYQQQLDEWQAEVKRWEAGGKEGKKPGRPSKLKEVSFLGLDEIESLPDIPTGWAWIKYGDLCSIVRNGISKKPVGEEGEKIFRISAVRPMFFDMNDYRIIDNSSGVFDRYFLQKGDLVFTRYNGSRRYVGVCAEYKSKEGRLFPDKLVQTRVDLSILNTSFLEKALNCGGSRKFVESKIRTTAGQSGVSGGDIKNIPVPICSLGEQIEISKQLDAILSVLDEQKTDIDQNLQRSEALRQSILKKAFSGQLVAQDPNDEPASELLQRIQAKKSELVAQARAAKAVGKKKTTGRKKVVAK